MINTALSAMPTLGAASIQSPIQKVLPALTKTPTNPYGGPDISFIEKLMESMGIGQEQGLPEPPSIRPPMIAGVGAESQKKEGQDDLSALLNSLRAMLQGNTPNQPQNTLAGATYGGTLNGAPNQRISDMLGYGTLSGDNTQGWGRK